MIGSSSIHTYVVPVKDDYGFGPAAELPCSPTDLAAIAKYVTGDLQPEGPGAKQAYGIHVGFRLWSERPGTVPDPKTYWIGQEITRDCPRYKELPETVLRSIQAALDHPGTRVVETVAGMRSMELDGVVVPPPT